MLNKLSLILGLIGTFGTAYSVIMNFYWNRVDVDLCIVDYAATSNSLVLYMAFTNNSRLPISITDISIWNKSVLYSCRKDPAVVRVYTRRTGGKLVYMEALKSLPFPITLPSLSGTSGYLYFQIPQGNVECDAKALTFQLSTNRLRTLQKTLEFPKN